MITLGIMLVRIVLHVHPMPVIQEFELIEINSFIHGRISYKDVGFHYISYILQLKRGATAPAIKSLKLSPLEKKLMFSSAGHRWVASVN